MQDNKREEQRETHGQGGYLVTHAIQLCLVLLLLLPFGWLGDSSPSWRHMPSITQVYKQIWCLLCLSHLSFWLVTANNNHLRLFLSAPTPALPVTALLCLLSVPSEAPAALALVFLPEQLTYTGLDVLLSLYLFPPFLSIFLWWLFLFLCPQEASTDQVLGPSAFPGSHSSRMGRETGKSNHTVGHPLDDSEWLTQTLGQWCAIHQWITALPLVKKHRIFSCLINNEPAYTVVWYSVASV